MDKFWMVHRLGGTYTVVRHPILEEARAEAARLALIHIGTAFVVLESIGHFRREDTTWTPHISTTKINH